jgi:hypothetical protein
MQPINVEVEGIFRDLRHNMIMQDLQQIQHRMTSVIMEGAKLARKTQCKNLIEDMIKRDFFL